MVVYLEGLLLAGNYMSAKLIMRQNSTTEYPARTDRPSVDYPLLCTVIRPKGVLSSGGVDFETVVVVVVVMVGLFGFIELHTVTSQASLQTLDSRQMSPAHEEKGGNSSTVTS